MATNKPGITVYITDEIKAALEAYKSDRQHRSISAAVEVILKEFFGTPIAVAGLDDRIDAKLDPLMAELGELRGKISDVEQSIAATALPVDDAVQAGDRLPELTTDQAYEIARSRGYPSSRNSFKDWSARKSADCIEKYGLMRFEGKHGRNDQLLFADVRSPTLCR